MNDGNRVEKGRHMHPCADDGAAVWDAKSDNETCRDTVR